MHQRKNDRKPSGIEKLSGSAPEGSKTPTAAREAPSAISSHTSGEAWPLQVRPTRWEGKSKGGWEGVARQNQKGQLHNPKRVFGLLAIRTLLKRMLLRFWEEPQQLCTFMHQTWQILQPAKRHIAHGNFEMV
ncbi:hypothetical protein NDU88_003959 [Pleurodeles waltl]|uniref:Uncharacterized protein n=1 Tax=Pleurodeles waltl TaxID=8319 RepID=A0AAV7NI74_PLEWA|nr:hypothetical protein NDU88_003959 [Pleurodeles waltl]